MDDTSTPEQRQEALQQLERDIHRLQAEGKVHPMQLLEARINILAKYVVTDRMARDFDYDWLSYLKHLVDSDTGLVVANGPLTEVQRQGA
jgi:hypothetical protein